MTERDWRIFREDFNIAYKGNHNALPLRYWNEAPLPKPIMDVSYGVVDVRCGAVDVNMGGS